MQEPHADLSHPADLEIPEADAAEQAAQVDDPEPESPGELPEDADEGDAVEQIREVRLDEDEYR